MVGKKSAVQQQNVLITGAAGGIGRATVFVFDERGWNVIGVDRKPFGAGFPEAGFFIQLDIADIDELEQVFQQVRQRIDRLHALVNNAAIQFNKPLLETSLQEWDDLMHVNLRAPFLCVQQAYPLLKKAQGAVVNVSSIHAVATSADIAAYAASKGALLALTRAMAIEFADDNVRVNAILPGAVDTTMLRKGLERENVKGESIEERLDDLAKKTVIGRVGKPEEIANAIYFLADNRQSSFMTGQPLIVDGGATTRLSTE